MKIGIVGSGFVGTTAAYALVMRGVMPPLSDDEVSALHKSGQVIRTAVDGLNLG